MDKKTYNKLLKKAISDFKASQSNDIRELHWKAFKLKLSVIQGDAAIQHAQLEYRTWGNRHRFHNAGNLRIPEPQLVEEANCLRAIFNREPQEKKKKEGKVQWKDFVVDEVFYFDPSSLVLENEISVVPPERKQVDLSEEWQESEAMRKRQVVAQKNKEKTEKESLVPQDWLKILNKEKKARRK